MSWKQFEELLDKSEAILNFDHYKRETARLTRELEQEKKLRADDTQRLENEISKLKNLRVKYGENMYSLEEFDVIVQKGLEEAKEKKIEKSIQDRWTRESSALLEQRLKVEFQKYPNNCSPLLKSLVDSRAINRMNELLKNPATWPKWFLELHSKKVEQDINKGLNDAFYIKVEEGARRKLQELVQIRWPQYIEEKITPFCMNSIKNQLISLSQPLHIACNRCGTQMDVTMSSDDIA